jgi:hypothetical protein
MKKICDFFEIYIYPKIVIRACIKYAMLSKEAQLCSRSICLSKEEHSAALMATK